jgi:adenylylsulfate kinase
MKTDSPPNNNNITWHNGFVSSKDREKLHRHKGAVVWFTGFSASGKSTIAHHLEKMLHQEGCSTYVFDGDNVRHGLCGDLGFSLQDRSENVRRIGEMVKLFVEAGIIAITAFISPYRQDRRRIRSFFSSGQFLEIFVDCPLKICEGRDQKGIYARAKSGEIKEFTGISAPYEPPQNSDLVIASANEDAISAAKRVKDLMLKMKIFT